MNKEKENNKKVRLVASIVIGFIILITAGFLIIFGAVFEHNGLIYSGCFLLILGTIIYFFIFIALVKMFYKYSLEKK